MIAEAAVAIEFAASSEDLARCATPTPRSPKPSATPPSPPPRAEARRAAEQPKA